jgi:hypothetical protein
MNGQKSMLGHADTCRLKRAVLHTRAKGGALVSTIRFVSQIKNLNCICTAQLQVPRSLKSNAQKKKIFVKNAMGRKEQEGC